MKFYWTILVLLLGFIISVPINGDTYHYRVIRKICPSGSYHDPIKDRCRKVPGGGNMIKFNFDARCSNRFEGLLAHSHKSRYYFVCRRDAVLTCMCGPKEHFNRIRLRCERKYSKMTKQDQRSSRVVDNIIQKYHCVSHHEQEEETTTSINFDSPQTPMTFRSIEITNYDPVPHFEKILAELYKLRALSASFEELNKSTYHEASTETRRSTDAPSTTTPREPQTTSIAISSDSTTRRIFWPSFLTTDPSRTKPTFIQNFDSTETTSEPDSIARRFENQQPTPTESKDPPIFVLKNDFVMDNSTQPELIIINFDETKPETSSNVPTVIRLSKPEDIVRSTPSTEDDLTRSSTSTTENVVIVDRVLDEFITRDPLDTSLGDIGNSTAKKNKETFPGRRFNSTKDLDYDFKDEDEHKKHFVEYYEVYQYYYDDAPNVTLWETEENKTEIVEVTSVESKVTTFKNSTSTENTTEMIPENLELESTTKDFNESTSTTKDFESDEMTSSTFSYPKAENLVTESVDYTTTSEMTSTTVYEESTVTIDESTLYEITSEVYKTETTEVHEKLPDNNYSHASNTDSWISTEKHYTVTESPSSTDLTTVSTIQPESTTIIDPKYYESSTEDIVTSSLETTPEETSTSTYETTIAPTSTGYIESTTGYDMSEASLGIGQRSDDLTDDVAINYEESNLNESTTFEPTSTMSESTTNIIMTTELDTTTYESVSTTMESQATTTEVEPQSTTVMQSTTDMQSTTEIISTTEVTTEYDVSTTEPMSTTDFTTENDYFSTEQHFPTTEVTTEYEASTTELQSTTEVTTENDSYEFQSTTAVESTTEFQSATEVTTENDSHEFQSTTAVESTTEFQSTTEVTTENDSYEFQSTTEVESDYQESTTESVTTLEIQHEVETTTEEISVATGESLPVSTSPYEETSTIRQHIESTTIRKNVTITTPQAHAVDYYSISPKVHEIEFYYDSEEYYDDMKSNTPIKEDLGKEQPNKRRHDNSFEYYVDSISASLEERKKLINNFVNFNFKIFNFDHPK